MTRQDKFALGMMIKFLPGGALCIVAAFQEEPGCLIAVLVWCVIAYLIPPMQRAYECRQFERFKREVKRIKR